jgi:hypothetical protein
VDAEGRRFFGWHGVDGAISVTFDRHGFASEKRWTPFGESILDKLARWLHLQ